MAFCLYYNTFNFLVIILIVVTSWGKPLILHGDHQLAMADGKKQRTNKTTPLSELAYGDLQRLGSRLDDVCEGTSTWWRKLIEAKSDKMYDVYTVAKLSRSSQQPGGSPGYELLVDLGNRGTTLGELVSLLKKIQFYDALKELGYKGV